ncbi:MAG: hypothetical protein MUC82_15940 [Cypionkella sp.]|jgi:hypothetical protein|nr:hypothetical protein [Cypionkella sp.]
MMRRDLALAGAALLLLLAGPASAERYADYGKPEQCGAYAEAGYDRSTYFPGGEGGVITLNDPQSVRGLNALLFEGTMTEEGMSDPVGRVLVARGPLREVTGEVAPEVVVVITENGIRLLQPCP